MILVTVGRLSVSRRIWGYRSARPADGAPGRVVEICTRLDGLPLPIELAAAWRRVISPEQLWQRLAERFTVVTTAERHVPPRQRTLRLSIDWSYELCTPAEQRLWQ